MPWSNENKSCMRVDWIIPFKQTKILIKIGTTSKLMVCMMTVYESWLSNASEIKLKLSSTLVLV